MAVYGDHSQHSQGPDGRTATAPATVALTESAKPCKEIEIHESGRGPAPSAGLATTAVLCMIRALSEERCNGDHPARLGHRSRTALT